MNTRLNKFILFANSLFPHETAYLMNIQRFEDEEKLNILKLLHSNATHSAPDVKFDESLDRRKYSYMMTWCQDQLARIDVDNIFSKLCDYDRMIMTDNIDLKIERNILKLFRQAGTDYYSFLKLYDIGRSYRHFLQIRMRHHAFQVVDQFLRKHRTSYEYARMVNDKMHTVTEDIIEQYKSKHGDTMVYEQWLDSVYKDEGLDGYNRVLAWIRILFIAHNYRMIDRLSEKFDYFETMINNSKFYSRRILANFYSQKLLYFASQNKLDKAIEFGYLSIRERNNDYLYYINNLAAVLLRAGRHEEALRILLLATEDTRRDSNYHNKISHAAYLIMSRIENKLYKQAESSGDVFFNAYKAEIFEHRWHLFMTYYLRAILLLKNYKKIIRIVRQTRLMERDRTYMDSPNYTTVIPWIYNVANYHDGLITKEEFDTHTRELLLHPLTGEAFPEAVVSSLKKMGSSIEIE